MGFIYCRTSASLYFPMPINFLFGISLFFLACNRWLKFPEEQGIAFGSHFYYPIAAIYIGFAFLSIRSTYSDSRPRYLARHKLLAQASKTINQTLATH
jgi:hypothetical protein